MALQITSDEKEPVSKIVKSVTGILQKNKLLTLSTYDETRKQPHCCSAYYVFDDEFNIYVWTSPESVHGKHIKENSNLAVNIADTKQPWGSQLQGLQIHGTARLVTLSELVKAGAMYLKRFSKAMMRVKNAKDFHAKRFQSRIFKIAPSMIKVFDKKAFKEGEGRIIRLHR